MDEDRSRDRAGGITAAGTRGGAGRVEGRRQLDRNDGVGAWRDGGAGGDTDCAASGHLDLRRLARSNLADDLEADRSVFGRAGRVGCPDRVAVHRRVVPRR